MHNPYLDAYRDQYAHELAVDPLARLREQPQPEGGDGARLNLVCAYSWAIPNTAALDTIAAHSPCGVVEIGAGGGYWARLLRERGVDVVAYDPDPDGGAWSAVLTGDHTAVEAHPGRTLLLVWPSYGAAWTDRVLELYRGDTVIYVGEDRVVDGEESGTGSDRMHELLATRYEQTVVVEIPCWYGVHDRLTVHRRVERAA